MIQKLRRLFPRHGRPYELFDTSVLLLMLGFLGYVLTVPVVALEVLPPLRFITEIQLGFVVTVCAIVAIVCSYFQRFLTIGYTVAIFGSTLMCANFLIGSFFHGGWATDVGLRALLSAILYGWITRNFFRNAITYKDADLEACLVKNEHPSEPIDKHGRSH